MCLGVPMKLTQVEGREGKAEIDGVSRRVALDLVPGAHPRRGQPCGP